MKANKKYLQLAMARACLGRSELAEKAGVSEKVIQNLIGCHSVRPATLGKIARALGVDPLEIMEQEE